MKRSSDVPARLLTATAAALLTGCSSGVRQVRNCVDEKGNLIPDTVCEGTYSGTGYHGGHFVYGGTVRGGRVFDSRLTPTQGAHVVTSGGRTISRGGFGRSGGFFGG